MNPRIDEEPDESQHHLFDPGCVVVGLSPGVVEICFGAGMLVSVGLAGRGVFSRDEQDSD